MPICSVLCRFLSKATTPGKLVVAFRPNGISGLDYSDEAFDPDALTPRSQEIQGNHQSQTSSSFQEELPTIQEIIPETYDDSHSVDEFAGANDKDSSELAAT
jgi:hypothetical protein